MTAKINKLHIILFSEIKWLSSLANSINFNNLLILTISHGLDAITTEVKVNKICQP